MWTYLDFTRYLADSICNYATTVAPKAFFTTLTEQENKETYEVVCRQSISSMIDRITFVVDKVFPAATTWLSVRQLFTYPQEIQRKHLLKVSIVKCFYPE